MKIAWLTDIHLNFVDKNTRDNFYHKIVNTQCDAVIISGDIAEATSVEGILKEMANYIKKPIYFVLGNHDYYRGQVESVHTKIIELTKSQKHLYWLPEAGIQQLDNATILLGQDGWADGRLGNYYGSNVTLNDSRLITDLFQQQILGKKQLLEKMQALADHDASQLKTQLEQAVSIQPKKIIAVMHVPPFKEASTYRGKISDDNYLPFYASKVIGDILMQVAIKNTAIEFLVLCGHTHGEARYQPLPNLTVKTGGAEYYNPMIQEILV